MSFHLPLRSPPRSHPPLPLNEPERLAKLRSFGVLDTPPEWSFDHITCLTSRFFRTPFAAVSLVDEHRQWFKSRLGLTFRESCRCDSFCAHAILADDVFVVADAMRDPRFKANPFVLGNPGIRFYAGAPLRAGEGLRLGTLCVLDTVARTFTKGEERMLVSLASLVVDELALRSSAQAALLESEGRFRQLVEQAGDGFFVYGLDGRVLDVNQQACAALGYSREELLRLSLPDLECNGGALAVLSGSGAKGSIQSVSGRYRRQNGTTFPVEARVSFLVRDGREVVLALVRDVTQHQQAETRLRLAKEEAEEANAAKTEFLSRMSHELRTPLNAILGFSRLLERQMVSAAQQDCIGHVVRGGERLLKLIDKVLEVSRAETGALQLSVQPVSVAEVVRESVEAARAAGARHQITLGVAVSAAERQMVLADRQRLKQVLLHLLANGLEFSEVEADYRVVDGQVRIGVRDRGPGLAPEQLGRLFIPFQRLETSEERPAGLGLGLVLCKYLIEAMGGTIGVDSAVGRGSLFWVQLPAAVPTEPSAPQPGRELKTRESAPIVLYIDDDESNLTLVKYLVAADQSVVLLTALRGSSGLELAHTAQPDLILLDLHLPDLAGEEVLARLRSDAATCAIPVVAVSGEVQPEKREQLSAAGVQAYVTKPVDLQEVRALFAGVRKRPASLPAAA